MSKLNPRAQEFVPSSRRAPPAAAAQAAGGLSADAPVFVSAAEYFGGAGAGAGQLQVGGGGGRDSSSDGSSNGGGQPQNRRVGELNEIVVLVASAATRIDLTGYGLTFFALSS